MQKSFELSVTWNTLVFEIQKTDFLLSLVIYLFLNPSLPQILPHPHMPKIEINTLLLSVSYPAFQNVLKQRMLERDQSERPSGISSQKTHMKIKTKSGERKKRGNRKSPTNIRLSHPSIRLSRLKTMIIIKFQETSRSCYNNRQALFPIIINHQESAHSVPLLTNLSINKPRSAKMKRQM